MNRSADPGFRAKASASRLLSRWTKRKSTPASPKLYSEN